MAIADLSEDRLQWRMPIARLSPRIAGLPTAAPGASHQPAAHQARRVARLRRNAFPQTFGDRTAVRAASGSAASRHRHGPGRTIFGKIRSARAPERLTGALRFRAGDAALRMIVDEAHRLHEGMDRSRTDKSPAALLQILRHRNGRRRG